MDETGGGLTGEVARQGGFPIKLLFRAEGEKSNQYLSSLAHTGWDTGGVAQVEKGVRQGAVIADCGCEEEIGESAEEGNPMPAGMQEGRLLLVGRS